MSGFVDEYLVSPDSEFFQYDNLNSINELLAAFDPQKYGCIDEDENNKTEGKDQTSLLDRTASEERSMQSLQPIDISQNSQSLTLDIPITSYSSSIERRSSTSPTSTETITSCTSPEIPQSKRQSFLQRNRMAASKARAKKRTFISDLQAQEIALEVKRDELIREVADLKTQLNVLEQVRALHIANGCLGLEELCSPCNTSNNPGLTQERLIKG
jgi:hypothetical protein